MRALSWVAAAAMCVGACAERARDAAPPPVPRTDVDAALAAGVDAGPSAELPAEVRADADEDTARALPIRPRSQAREAPGEGWCGETAIQEALLHLGAWAPQALINRAGRPRHPDLYSPEIPVALEELGVRYSFYRARERGFEPFARWIAAAIDAGDPVLAGVKILPTKHPEWGLDHFVLVVGYGRRGLLVNTTWGRREWVSDGHARGLSFDGASYAVRLRAVVLPRGATRARVTVQGERDDRIVLRVACTDLAGGGRARIERRTGSARASPSWSRDVTAVDGRIEIDVESDAREASWFHCRPL